MNIISFDSLPSTNKYCELLDLNRCEEFTVISAKAQTAGIGQRGNVWESHPNENLTFSLILKPTFLPISHQFQLTKSISIGIANWLRSIVPNQYKIHIKWPNDIYVDNRKICGTLISTKVNSSGISAAIAGIGLNVNQTHFSDWIPNPVSLKQLTDSTFNLDNALRELNTHIISQYQHLLDDIHTPDQDYLNRLLNLGERKQYIFHNQPIHATIQDVNQFGHLVLKTDDGQQITCQMKEIQYVI